MQKIVEVALNGLNISFRVYNSGVSKPGPIQAWALVKLAGAWVKFCYK